MNKPIELNEQQQPVMTQKERDRSNIQHIRAITFGLKVIEDILTTFCLDATSLDITAFFTSHINLIAEITSLSCEQSEQVIKNQSQILFHLIMTQILELKIPVREQFEIMYIKCVLKPIISRINKMKEEKELSDQEAETEEVNIEETKEAEVQLKTDL